MTVLPADPGAPADGDSDPSNDDDNFNEELRSDPLIQLPPGLVSEVGLEDGLSQFAATQGTIVIGDPDGIGDIATVLIAGQPFTLSQLLTIDPLSPTFQIPLEAGDGDTETEGVLTLQGFDPLSGVISFSVTLSSPVNNTNPLGNSNIDQNSALVPISATVTDLSGASATATGGIRVVDATPFVLASGEEPLLTVDETVLGTNATANFGGNFSSAFGADGAGSLSYAVGTAGGESGLVDTATGEVVNLINNGGVIEGRTSGSNDLVFTVTVNSATGEVTLDQIRAVVHPTDDPNEPTSLSADNLVTVTGTIIDKDGDTQNATLNIGSNLVFLDDGPSISTTGEEPLLTVDETVLGTNATANFGGNFSSAFGADGAGSLSYAVGTAGGESGLVDTATGEVVNLINNGGVIEGRTSGSNDLVFTVTVNSATGEVTLDQIRAVVHPTDDPNEPTSLSADNLVTVTGTIIDKDGDTQNATLNIGSNLVFLDDGPSISVTDALADANKDGIADSPIIAFIPNTAGAQAAGTYMLAYGSDGAFADSSLQLSDSPQLNWLDPLSGYSFVKDVDGQASTVYVAYKTGDSTKPLFQVLVKNDGTYEFTLLDPAPSESNTVSNVLAGISGGSNLASYTIPGSAFNNDFSLLLTATDNKGASTLTISSTELGIGGNTIQQQFDEVLKVDIQPIGSGGAETIILDKVSVGIANTGSLKAGDSFILATYYVDPDANGPILPDVDSETVVYDGSGELIFEGFLPGLTVDYVEFGAVSKNVNFKITGIGLDYEVITPPGDYSYSFELVAKDGDSDTAADQFTVFIDGDNDGDWGVTPIVLDLDGDGVELLSVEEGAVIDYGQGFVASAWMSSDDALLVYDYNNDGQITEANEFVFTMWGTNSDVSTDMQALAAYFDADANGVKDGVLDANDTAWSYFGAWQDLNVDGVQDEGEFAYLADWDITGIALFYDADSTTYAAADGDVLVYGQMTVTYTDGSTGMAQDVAFAVATVEAPFPPVSGKLSPL